MCDDVGSALGGIAGGVGGFFLGGPMGAMAGYAAGSALGDAIDGSEENDFTIRNPGGIDLGYENPEMYKELEYMRRQRGDFDRDTSRWTDPRAYEAMRNEMQDQARNRVANNFGGMGLAGSSMAMGAGENAARLTDLQMLDRQLGDQLKIRQMQMGMTGQIQGNIGFIQNQFGQYQGQILGAEQAAQAAGAAQTSSLLSAVGTIGGAYFGGPAGAAAGGAAGNMLGGSMFGGSNPYGSGGSGMGWNPTPTPPSLGMNTDLGYGWAAPQGGGGGYAPGYFGGPGPMGG